MRSNADLKRLLDRISQARKAMYPKSDSLAAAYERIGAVLSGDMKVRANIGKFQKGGGQAPIHDDGALSNNTTYKINPDGVEIGTFGVPYAKYHEFGTKPSHKMWIYLLANVFGKNGNRKPKGVIKTSGKGRNREAWIRARPYVRPVLKDKKNQQFIIDTLRKAMQP